MFLSAVTTTQQSIVIPELQYLVSAPGLAASSCDNEASTPTIDAVSLFGNSSKAFIRDVSVSSLSNSHSVPQTLRRIPSMQDLRKHYTENATNVNVSGPRLEPPTSFRLANATPSSYVGHEHYSESSATCDMSMANFRMASPSCFVDTELGVCSGSHDCSDNNYGHEPEIEIGYPDLKSAFDWSSDEDDNGEDDNGEDGLKWRIRRLKKKLLARQCIRGKSTFNPHS